MITEQITITPRQAAHLVARLATPKVPPVVSAAEKHEPKLRALFVKSARKAQDAAPMRELENVLSMGHGGTGAVEYVLEDVLKVWERTLLGDGVEAAPTNWLKMRAAAGNEKDLPSLLSGAMASGAEAVEVCVPGVSSREALSAYQDYAYKTINKELREGQLGDKTRDYVDAIDKAFADVKAAKIEVFRGDGAGVSSTLFEKANLQAFKLTPDMVGTDRGDAILEMLEKRFVGTTFSDGAFVSTAKTEKAAMKFVGGSSSISQYGGQGLLEITGRAKALDVDKLTGLLTAEKERLLPRDTVFRVKGIDVGSVPGDSSRIFLRWIVEVVK